MPIFNGGFPASYQPVGYQYPAYQMPQTQPPQMGQQAPQMMTPPTIRAEIVQVDGEAAAEKYPLAAGTSQMMIGRDDSFIAVKTQGEGQQYTMTYYDKRPPAPPEPPLDLSAYVRREEVEAIVAALIKNRDDLMRHVEKQKEERRNEQRIREAWSQPANAPAGPAAEPGGNAPAAPAGPGGYGEPGRV